MYMCMKVVCRWWVVGGGWAGNLGPGDTASKGAQEEGDRWWSLVETARVNVFR